MNLSLWSDEDRWFVPRTFGLGYSLNLKYVVKRLGWIKTSTPPELTAPTRAGEGPAHPESRQDRLRRQADESKYEVRP
ncbi:MAG: hypothetical protein ABFD77_00800 [Thermotogota bacterium]